MLLTQHSNPAPHFSGSFLSLPQNDIPHLVSCQLTKQDQMAAQKPNDHSHQLSTNHPPSHHLVKPALSGLVLGYCPVAKVVILFLGTQVHWRHSHFAQSSKFKSAKQEPYAIWNMSFKPSRRQPTPPTILLLLMGFVYFYGTNLWIGNLNFPTWRSFNRNHQKSEWGRLQVFCGSWMVQDACIMNRTARNLEKWMVHPSAV